LFLSLPGTARPDELTVSVIVPRFLTAGGPPAEASAQVRTAANHPVPDGTPVRFSASLGVTFSPIEVRTSGGVASSTVFAGAESGFARVDATTAGGRGHATLWVRPGPAARAELTASPVRTAPGGRVSVGALVTDQYGNAADGDAVVWTAEGGRVEPVQSHVERGRAATTLVAGAGPSATVRLAGAGLNAAVMVPIDVLERPTTLYLPSVEARSTGCANVLANSTFQQDRDSDGAPDSWSVEPGAGGAERVVAQGRPGWAVRLTGTEAGPAPEISQRTGRVPRAPSTAALRVWLRSGVTGSVRLDAWSTADIGGRQVWAPFLVESLEAADAWQLHVLALPLPPVDDAEVSVRLQGEGTADLTGLELIVCP
jgi:hypothetical protein